MHKNLSWRQRIFTGPVIGSALRGRPIVRAKRLGVEVLESRLVPASPLVSQVLGGTTNTLIRGTVYDDVDRSGTRTNGENGIAGWTVYLDLDQSGTLNADAEGVLEPTALTNADGDFQISHLMPGTYRLAQVLQSGWEPTAPTFLDVTVQVNRETTADFFNFSGGDITGAVWNDVNGNGSRDPEDAGLAGWTVFLDLDKSGGLDAGEPYTTTGADGEYRFHNLPADDYEVTEVLPAHWDVTEGYDTHQTASVAARASVVQDFGNVSLGGGTIVGSIWNDQNADSLRDPSEPGLAGWTVFLDTNGDRMLNEGETFALTDGTGAYIFLGLLAGDYDVTEVVPEGWSVSPELDISQTVTVAAGEASVAADFGNFTTLNGSIRGVAWNDVNRDGVREVNLDGTFAEPALVGWTVYLDRDGNGLPDPGEPTTLTGVDGSYEFLDLQVGEYEVREILPSGWEPSLGHNDSYNVMVFSGTQSLAPDFANFNVGVGFPGSISGIVWRDLNGNGVRDVDPGTGAYVDPGLAGRTLFVDANSNGVLDALELSAVSAADGSYTLAGVLPGSVTVLLQAQPGWQPTAPVSGAYSFALRNGENLAGLDFGSAEVKSAAVRGMAFDDADASGSRDPGEKGLAGLTLYLDLNHNGVLDPDEPQTVTLADQFFTPAVDESGTYSFTHLAAGDYTLRVVIPEELSATTVAARSKAVTLAAGEERAGVDFAARYRPVEIHGVAFEDMNADHVRDAGEPGRTGATVYLDLDRDNVLDAREPTTTTGVDGTYDFTGLAPGAYVVREVLDASRESTYPATSGGVLWPGGTSHAAVGNVTPGSITLALADGETHRETVSLTLPNTGGLTNLVDVFLLFDDTGSFVSNSPIVRGAFPTIISQLQAALPTLDLGFGVGRFEEYANFAWEYDTGRPFILNQPIVAAGTPGYLAAIQAALDRTTPGYGGDQPETDIEALYQLVTGLGFDGNNNGSVLDSGAAGRVSTQLTPGSSGDVPSFASYVADPSDSELPAAGSLGGGGFRAGALPVILLATDTGFAYQPAGETTISGVGGVTLPISALTETSRPTTPYHSGASIQQTVTALNALGALVIGLGTNDLATLDPRQGLESLSKLTGAINRSTTTIANGTSTPIAPGNPFYFQIASGFADSVAAGVVNAIQNAVTNVALDVTVQASDPRVHLVNHTGIRHTLAAGQTAAFDIEFTGDGIPRRFDLQFVRAGTNVVLGSVPVVIGTPVPGEGYAFEDCQEGEIHGSVDFGSHEVAGVQTPAIQVATASVSYDGSAHKATATATGTGGEAIAGTFTFTYNGSATPPIDAGIYTVVATFTSSDPSYSNATGTGMLTITAVQPTLDVQGGTFVYTGSPRVASASATGLGGAAVAGTISLTYNGLSAPPADAGVYSVAATFTSSDSNYANTTGTATLTITSAPTSIAVTAGTFTYDGQPHGASASATGVGGVLVPGTFATTYNGAAAAPVDAGIYAVEVAFTSEDANYANVVGTGTLILEQAKPVFTNLAVPTVVEGTSSVQVTGHLADGAVVPAGAVIHVAFQGTDQTAVLDSAGNFTATLDSTGLQPGTYSIGLSYAGSSNFAAAGASANLVVQPVVQPVGITISNVSKFEGDSGTTEFQFVVKLSAAASVPVSVSYATKNGTADSSDYIAVAPTGITFAVGEVQKVIVIQVLGDLANEPNQYFDVVLSNPVNAVLVDGVGRGTIRNDDPGLSISDAKLLEGNAGTQKMAFTVTLSQPQGQAVTVNYATSNGSALAGSDYVAIPPTLLTFAPGQTSKTIYVDVIGDTTPESHEKFYVKLSGATGAVLLDALGVGNIRNDDTRISIAGVALYEGQTGTTAFNFRVRLSKPTDLPVSITLATAGGTAQAGIDYQPLAPTQIVFAPGEVEKTVTVLVNGDLAVEPGETFFLVLSDPVNGVLGVSTVKATIRNDDLVALL